MIFLRLFCIFATVQSEIHNLHYIYTALSKPISQPGVYQFTAMGILNGRQIDFCNSTDKVKMLMQKWMEEHNETDYSLKGTQSRRRMEHWFDFSIKILKDHMRQNKPDPDVHILQWMHGCQAEKTSDGNVKFLKGFHQYGYDGEDFLSFDSENMAWVVHVNAAESTKKKWDNERILSQHTKEYLETECVHWLEKLVKLQTFSPPEVYFFSKKSTSPDYRTLVCLATGFYHRDVTVNILKEGVPLGEWDRVSSSGVRPNGDRKQTYQLRKWLEIKASDTAKYSCRIHHRTLPSPIEESWDGKCRNCDSNNTGAIVGGVVGVVFLIVLVKVLVVLCVLRKKKIEKEKAARALVDGLKPLNEVSPETKGSTRSVESWGSGWEFTVYGEPKEVHLMANEVSPETKGSTRSVESWGSGKGSFSSDRLKGWPLMGNEVSPETKGSTRSVESWGSVLLACGSICSGGPKEEVDEPLMGNEEGEQQPQLEAAEVE